MRSAGSARHNWWVGVSGPATGLRPWRPRLRRSLPAHAVAPARNRPGRADSRRAQRPMPLRRRQLHHEALDWADVALRPPRSAGRILPTERQAPSQRRDSAMLPLKQRSICMWSRQARSITPIRRLMAQPEHASGVRQLLRCAATSSSRTDTRAPLCDEASCCRLSWFRRSFRSPLGPFLRCFRA